MNNQITYKQIITAVRSRLEGGQETIADVPCPFRETWWPETPDFQTQPSSELEKWIYEVFSEEVKAIRGSLKDTGYEPELAEWQKGSTRAARNLWTSTNIQAAALGFWEEIVIPVRRRGDLIFHILAPRAHPRRRRRMTRCLHGFLDLSEAQKTWCDAQKKCN